MCHKLENQNLSVIQSGQNILQYKSEGQLNNVTFRNNSRIVDKTGAYSLKLLWICKLQICYFVQNFSVNFVIKLHNSVLYHGQIAENRTFV